MHQDKPLHVVKRVATCGNNDSTKRKTVRRQKVFKTSSWYEIAALSIQAAPRAVPRRTIGHSVLHRAYRQH